MSSKNDLLNDYGWEMVLQNYIPYVPKDKSLDIEKAYLEIRSDLYKFKRSTGYIQIGCNEEITKLSFDTLFVDDLINLLMLLSATNTLTYKTLMGIGQFIYTKFTTGISQDVLDHLLERAYIYKTSYSDKIVLLLISWGAKLLKKFRVIN